MTVETVTVTAEEAQQGKGPDGAIACTATLTAKVRDDRKAMVAEKYLTWRSRDETLPLGFEKGEVRMPIQYSVAKSDGGDPDVRLHGATAPSQALLVIAVRRSDWADAPGGQTTCLETSMPDGRKATACGTIQVVPTQ